MSETRTPAEIIAGTPINEPGVVYFYQGAESNHVYQQILNQETLAAVREAPGLVIRKFYTFSPEQLAQLERAPIAGLAAAKWEGIERRAQLAAPKTPAMADLDKLLEAHASAAIAAHEHGDSGGYHHDLRAAEQGIRDAIAASRRTSGDEYRDALASIKQMTDAEDSESYRCDDREGCLDTVFSVASAALAAPVSAEPAVQGASAGCIKCPRDPNKRCDYCGYSFAATVSPPDGAMPEQAMVDLMPKRAAFLKWAKDRALDVTEDKDAWGRRKFLHAHIQSLWEGWFNAPATYAQPAEGSALVARKFTQQDMERFAKHCMDARDERLNRAPERSDAPAPDASEIEWSHDLQKRLISACQDMTEDDNARQVMAEAACLLASITGTSIDGDTQGDKA